MKRQICIRTSKNTVIFKTQCKSQVPHRLIGTQQKVLRRFNQKIAEIEEGIFVTKTDSAHSNLLYKQLKGIGPKVTKNILEDFKTIINTENQSYFEVNFLNLIKNPRVLIGLNLATSEANGVFLQGTKDL